MFALPCLDGCVCHYDIDDEANTMNCHHNNMTELPDQLLPRTEQLIMTGNHVINILFSKNRSDLSDLKTLNLENNSVRKIDEASFKALLLCGISVKLSGNHIRQVPPMLANINYTADIWLGRNPYECNCDTMWMRDWLLNATNVMDKEKIVCASGKWKGMYFQPCCVICENLFCYG